MNIIYLVFGSNIAYHLQTAFAVLTVLKYKRVEDIITVYTDMPQYYQRLNGRVVVKYLDKETLDKWISGTGYIFRAKIKAIEDSSRNNPDKDLLFLDGDTILRNDYLGEIAALLDAGNGVMYEDEGHPSKMKGKSKKMWEAVNNKSLDDCIISMKHNVWNSGVIGIPKEKKTGIIDMALRLCDMILSENVECFTAEQYAFSIAMQERCHLCEAKKWIGHYWGNKEQWHDLAMRFFLESYMAGRSIDEELIAIDSLLLKDIPLQVRRSNTRRRLIRIATKLFPDKPIESRCY